MTWTRKERDNYTPIDNFKLKALYCPNNGGIPTRDVEKRTDFLLRYLNEDLEDINIHKKVLGTNYSFNQVLKKFAEHKGNIALNMLEEMAISKIERHQ